MALDRPDLEKIFAEVQENAARLRSCTRHLFSVHDIQKIGQKIACHVCGGRMNLTDIGHYIEGYKAAGRSADDIMPGYDKTR